MIKLFGRAGGRHRRSWFWRRHRNDHPGWTHAELALFNKGYQVELAADRARRALAGSSQ